MNWRLPLFSGSEQQQPAPNLQNIPSQSLYPPFVAGSSPSPSTSSFSTASPHHRASHKPPAEHAEIIACLKDKSIDELQKLLKDKEAYHAFFNSLDQVKALNNVRDELKKETVQLAGENLEKEQCILELRNQCTIIRSTELAAAQDRLADLERQKEEIIISCSPAALLDILRKSLAKTDEESEALQLKLLEKEIDMPTFVQKYKKLRTTHNRRDEMRRADIILLPVT